MVHSKRVASVVLSGLLVWSMVPHQAVADELGVSSERSSASTNIINDTNSVTPPPSSAENNQNGPAVANGGAEKGPDAAASDASTKPDAAQGSEKAPDEGDTSQGTGETSKNNNQTDGGAADAGSEAVVHHTPAALKAKIGMNDVVQPRWSYPNTWWTDLWTDGPNCRATINWSGGFGSNGEWMQGWIKRGWYGADKQWHKITAGNSEPAGSRTFSWNMAGFSGVATSGVDYSNNTYNRYWFHGELKNGLAWASFDSTPFYATSIASSDMPETTQLVPGDSFPTPANRPGMTFDGWGLDRPAADGSGSYRRETNGRNNGSQPQIWANYKFNNPGNLVISQAQDVNPALVQARCSWTEPNTGSHDFHFNLSGPTSDNTVITDTNNSSQGPFTREYLVGPGTYEFSVQARWNGYVPSDVARSGQASTVQFDLSQAQLGAGAQTTATPNMQLVNHGSSATEPAAPRTFVSGAEFAYWSTDAPSANAAPYDFTAPVNGVTSLNAVWRTVRPASVTATAAGGDKVSATVKLGAADGADKVTLQPQRLENDGSWVNAGAPVDVTPAAGSDTVTGEVTVPSEGTWRVSAQAKKGQLVDSQATFSPEEFVTATFETGQGASVQGLQAVKKGDTLSKPADPTRTGYTFLGWVTADGSFEDFANGVSKPMNAPVHYTALWAHGADAATVAMGTDGSGPNAWALAYIAPTATTTYNKASFQFQSQQADGTWKNEGAPVETTFTNGRGIAHGTFDVTGEGVWRCSVVLSDSNDPSAPSSAALPTNEMVTVAIDSAASTGASWPMTLVERGSRIPDPAAVTTPVPAWATLNGFADGSGNPVEFEADGFSKTTADNPVHLTARWATVAPNNAALGQTGTPGTVTWDDNGAPAGYRITPTVTAKSRAVRAGASVTVPAGSTSADLTEAFRALGPGTYSAEVSALANDVDEGDAAPATGDAFSVDYDGNGDNVTGVAPLAVVNERTAPAPVANPANGSSAFAGWSVDAPGANAWDGSAFSAPTTLYASWDLAIPTNLTFADPSVPTLSWDPVDNATGYIVSIVSSNGQNVATIDVPVTGSGRPEADVSAAVAEPGTYAVAVSAYGPAGYGQSTTVGMGWHTSEKSDVPSGPVKPGDPNGPSQEAMDAASAAAANAAKEKAATIKPVSTDGMVPTGDVAPVAGFLGIAAGLSAMVTVLAARLHLRRKH
ncbi:InlB B-repeat-containing protein [Atopobiaceae bacterium 24-176]